MPNVSIRVPSDVPINGDIPVEWRRYFEQVSTPLSPSGSGTIYTTADGGATTTLATFASLLLTGMVRNIVVATVATLATNATNTYADTGLTASITPSTTTSTILVLVCQNGVTKDTGDTGVAIKLVRGTTDLAVLVTAAGSTGAVGTNAIGTVAGGWLDSPGKTASQTYKTQFASASNVANANVQSGSAVSLMVLIEVVA